MTAKKARASALSLGFSVAVAGAAIGASTIVIWLAGKSPGAAMDALWTGAFGDRQQLAGTLAKMVPLALIALAWIVAFSARRINIGFEGQITIGGVCSSLVALEVHGLPIYVHLPLAVLAGILGGALYAGLPAWLWATRHVNEIITTLLLNFVAAQLVSWLVRGPVQESTRTYAETNPFPGSARWPELLHATALTWDVIFVPLLVVGVSLMLTRTTLGFRLRLTGANEEAARFAGTRTTRVGATALVLSGAIAGLVGASLTVASEDSAMRENFSANYGFDGIVVALLARNNPIGCIPASLLFAALRQGGGLMEARVGVSQSLVQVTQGTVIVLLAGTGFLLARRWRRLRSPEDTTDPTPQLVETA